MNLKIFTDGGSRGNPGPGGAGVFIVDGQGKVIHKQSKYLGKVTNNEAEYMGIIISAEWLAGFVKKNKVDRAEWFLDSRLVVEQLNRNWKIKDEKIKKLAKQAFAQLALLSIPFSIKHIPREKNEQADVLVNQALDNVLCS